MCVLKNFPKKTCAEKNTSGILQIYAIATEYIDTITYQASPSAAGDTKKISEITLKAANKFAAINHDKIKGSLVTDGNMETIGAQNFASTASVFVPQMNSIVYEAIDAMAGVEMLLLVKKQSGLVEVIGSADFPAYLTVVNANSGTGEAGQVSGVTLTLARPRANEMPDFFTGNLDSLPVFT